MNFSPSFLPAAVDSAMRHIRGELDHLSLTDYDLAASILHQDIMYGAWEEALRECRGYASRQRAGKADEVVAACIRGGLDEKRDVKYDNGCFWLLLENQCYIVLREVGGFISCPLTAAGNSRWGTSVISLPADEFAAFLFSFDKMLPRIQEAVDKASSEVRSILLGREKERKISQILKTAKKAEGEV